MIVIGKCDHTGVNAYNKIYSFSCLMHPCGPHIFYANSDGVFNCLGGITKRRKYEHRDRFQNMNQAIAVALTLSDSLSGSTENSGRSIRA